MAQRINFTRAALNGLPHPPAGKRAFHYDEKTPGLAVQVTSSGAKTFYLYRRVQGRPERIRLGSYPGLTIEQARRQAQALNGEIANGANPNALKRGERGELTLGELYERYLADHIRPLGKSEKTLGSAWRVHLKPWAGRKLSAIKRSEVQALKTRLVKESKAAGSVNRVLGIVSALYGWAAEHDLHKGDNPAQGVKKLRAATRDRFLQADELPRFFKALADEPNQTIRDYIVVSLLTGARRGNVLAMEWREVNLERATWTIPAAKTKTGTDYTLPLTPVAVQVLEARQAVADGPWVFPSWGKTGHLVEPKKAWAALLKRADIEDLHLHDLRRSLGSWQAATGASLSIIGKSLGHQNVSTTAIYARLNLDPVRQAVDTAAAAMLQAAGIAPEGVVVDLKGGGR
jgi:integrase